MKTNNLKRALAVFLSALMLLGAAPAVFAADPTDDFCPSPSAQDGKHVLSWTSLGEQHFQKCNLCGHPIDSTTADHNWVSGSAVAPTCTEAGYTPQTCSVCGAERRTAEIAATGHNVNKTVWMHDDTNHWHECANGCGLHEDVEAHNIPVWGEPDGGFRYGKCDKCEAIIAKAVGSKITVTFMSGSQVMGTCETESGAKATYNGQTPVKTATSGMTYTFAGWSTVNTEIVNANSRVVNLNNRLFTEDTTLYAVFAQSSTRLHDVGITLSRNAANYTFSQSVGNTASISSQIRSQLTSVMGGALETVVFDSPDANASKIGTLYANRGSNPISYSARYSASDLDNIYFVPKASGTFYINYAAFNQYGHNISGLIEIVTSGTFAGTELRYDVNPADSLTFPLSDFYDFFRSHYSSSYSLSYVRFGTPSVTLNDSYGYIYYNYGRSGSERFDSTTLSRNDFYYNNTYSQYSLGSLTYVPGTRTGNYTVEIPFTAYGDSTHYASGFIVISVGEGIGGDITLTTTGNRNLDLTAAAFRDYFRKSYPSYDLTHVVFGSSSSLGSSNGYIYYDYNGPSQVQFTSSALANYQFYYSSRSYGTYPLDGLTFVPGTRSGKYSVEIPFTAYSANDRHVTGKLVINVTDGTDATIVYKVDNKGIAELYDRDFADLFNTVYPGTNLRYVRFGTGSNMSSSYGYLYYNFEKSGERQFTASTVDSYAFYCGSYSDYGTYPLNSLTFVPGTRTGSYTVEIPFTAYYNNTTNVKGTLVIEVGSVSLGQVKLSVARDKTLTLTEKPFSDLFDKKYSSYSLRYVRFGTGSNLGASYGYLYYNYGATGQRQFTASGIGTYTFYLGRNTTLGDFPLSALTFVPGSRTGKYTLEIPFTAYYDSSRSASGTLVIEVTDPTAAENFDILYNGTKDPVAIRAKDIADFFSKTYPSYTLNYIELSGVPSVGTLYYDRSATNGALTLTSSNYNGYSFYYNPTSSQRDLDKLTYVPSGKNYCVTIPFVAHGSSNRTVNGTIMISISNANLAEVYAVTTKGARVALSASRFNTRLNSATGLTFSYIKFAALPTASQGTLYYNYSSASSYGHVVNKTNLYYYSNSSSGAYQLNNITFVPASGYTGSITLPYVAYNSTGTPIAAGKLSLGVVNQIKSYSDVSGTDWFYKYVVELSDAGVVNGYPAGNFQPNGAVKYGEALKLIMLATGYNEQPAPAGTHWATGYMNRALADGLISNAVSNLNSTISREAVAQIAVKAMRLSTSSVSSGVFKDTGNTSVLALYKAGIVEGSFDAAGDRYYYPTRTITRAEVSAIIWRINQYSK